MFAKAAMGLQQVSGVGCSQIDVRDDAMRIPASIGLRLNPSCLSHWVRWVDPRLDVDRLDDVLAMDVAEVVVDQVVPTNRFIGPKWASTGGPVSQG